MYITKATVRDAAIVHDIVQKTISIDYPKYYDDETVNFFKAHHNLAQITEDIRKHSVFLFYHEDKPVGTGTIRDNEISRLFVLPEYQNNGHGSIILDMFERIIEQNYSKTVLHTMHETEEIYLGRGYQFVKEAYSSLSNHGVLRYHIMEKTFS